MLFAFSGFNLLHHRHLNMVAIVAHLPWLLAATDLLIVDERRRMRTLAVAAIAVILGSEFLLGFPAGCLVEPDSARRLQSLPRQRDANLAAPPAVRGRRADRHAARRNPAPAHGRHGGTLRAHGPHAGLRADLLAASDQSAPAVVALRLEAGVWSKVDPRWFHEFGIYSGAILPVGLVWVWIRRQALPARRRLIAAVTGFAGVTLLLALGRYGALAGLLSYLPVLRTLRAPARYIMLVQFALVILAAITLEDLIAIAGRRTPAASRYTPALWIPALLGIATTLALNTGVLPYGPQTFSHAAAAARARRLS